MWIGTFHGLCNRMLRAHYRDAGLPQTFQILDTAGPAVRDQAPDEGPEHRRRKVSRRKNLQYFINNAKEQGLRPKDVDATDDVQPQVRRALRSLRPAMPARRRGRFRGVAAALLRTARAQSAAARALSGALQAHPRRRVPGHQQAAIRLAQAARGRSTTRSSPSATTTSRSTRFAARTSATCPTSSANSTVRNLIKLEQNYRSHGHILDAANQLIAQQLAAARQEPAHRRGSRRAGARLRGARPIRRRRGWIVEEIKALINTGLAAARSRCCTAATRSRA